MDLLQSNFHLVIFVFSITTLTLLAYIVYNYKHKNVIISKYAENEVRLQTILDTAVDAVITINSKGIIQGFNKSAVNIFGWSEDEAIGQNVSFLMPNHHAKKHDGYIDNHLRTGRTRIIGSDQEVVAKHKTGRLFPIRLGVGRANIPGQEPLFVGFISDISKRKELEAEIISSQKEYSSLISNIPGTTFRAKVETDGFLIQFISEAVYELTGYSSADFCSGVIYFPDLVHPDDAESAMMAVQYAISNTHKYSLEYRLRHKSGEYLWVLDNSSVSRSEDGFIIIDGVLLDVTARRRMLEELNAAKACAESSAATKAAFLANMSHEIRTPMNSIIGFSEILLNEDIQSDHLKHLKTIHTSAKSLLHLLNEILDTAKLETGKLELDHSTFHLQQLIDSVISTLWFQAKEKNLNLSFYIDPSLSEYYFGDDNRIRQVLMNLMGNAIKFTDKGHVTLTVKHLKDGKEGALFIIKDTGIGIEEERLELIFEPFTQADSSMSRKFGGTGLGTTISKQLVNLMGGEIVAKSIVGLGSEFSFTIPMPSAEKEVKAENSVVQRIPPQRVLIVDDVDQNRELLTIILTRQGHTIEMASNGLEAVEKYKTFLPDITLMDIQMPVMDGISAALTIRDYEDTLHTDRKPIIALTASVLKEDRFEAEKAGMDGFATKPVDVDALILEMARVLNITTVKALLGSSDSQESDYKHINLSKGKTLWGSELEYISQIRSFVSQFEDIFTEIFSSIDSNKFDDVGFKIHRIKGIAGNLSLKLIFSKINFIESLCKSENKEGLILELNDIRNLILELEIELYSFSSVFEDSVLLLDDDDNFDAIELVDSVISMSKAGELNDELLAQFQKLAKNNSSEIVRSITMMISNFRFKDAILNLAELKDMLLAEKYKE